MEGEVIEETGKIVMVSDEVSPSSKQGQLYLTGYGFYLSNIVKYNLSVFSG